MKRAVCGKALLPFGIQTAISESVLIDRFLEYWLPAKRPRPRHKTVTQAASISSAVQSALV
jgi:hypothetical protein